LLAAQPAPRCHHLAQLSCCCKHRLAWLVHIEAIQESLTRLQPRLPCWASSSTWYKQFLGIGTEAHGREEGPGTPAHRSPPTSSGHMHPSIGPYPEPKSFFWRVLNVEIPPEFSCPQDRLTARLCSVDTVRDMIAQRATEAERPDLDTGKIKEWRSIVTLIVFVLTSK
jgi:hypothetical protein